jgi:hypothetical protein
MKELQELAITALKKQLGTNPNDHTSIDALTRLLDRVSDIIFREEGK